MGLRVAIVLLVALGSAAAAQSAKGSGGEPKAPATVVVVNRLERAVTIWIGGEMKGRVEPAGEARFSGIPAGPVSLQAGAAGSAGPVAGEERSLGSGETFTWTLYPVLSWEEKKGTGTLVVTNKLDHEVEVSFGGSPAGRLGPGATRAYPRVVAGDVKVSAADSDGNVVGTRDLSVMAGAIARWEIGTDAEAAAPRGGARN
jgi:hypothetical protein